MNDHLTHSGPATVNVEIPYEGRNYVVKVFSSSFSFVFFSLTPFFSVPSEEFSAIMKKELIRLYVRYVRANASVFSQSYEFFFRMLIVAFVLR